MGRFEPYRGDRHFKPTRHPKPRPTGWRPAPRKPAPQPHRQHPGHVRPSMRLNAATWRLSSLVGVYGADIRKMTDGDVLRLADRVRHPKRRRECRNLVNRIIAVRAERGSHGPQA